MRRIIIKNKPNAFIVDQYRSLNNAFKLSFTNLVKLLWFIKQGRVLTIDNLSDETIIDNYLENAYFALKDDFSVKLTILNGYYAAMSSISLFTDRVLMNDNEKGIRIYIDIPEPFRKYV